MKSIFFARIAIFALASTSFACLLGEFYHTWSMRVFACAILLPAMLILAGIAARGRDANASKVLWAASQWIIQGTLGGLIAAVAYDLFRLPFVLYGFPLFKVFPEFGKLLIGANQPNWAIQIVGWAYHFSNGAALGIMFLCLLPQKTLDRRMVIIAGVMWALLIETILLLTPYRNFFTILMPFPTFLVLTASAHLIFGAVLGWWLSRKNSLQRA